jgi:hypothetical protein
VAWVELVVTVASTEVSLLSSPQPAKTVTLIAKHANTASSRKILSITNLQISLPFFACTTKTILLRPPYSEEGHKTILSHCQAITLSLHPCETNLPGAATKPASRLKIHEAALLLTPVSG